LPARQAETATVSHPQTPYMQKISLFFFACLTAGCTNIDNTENMREQYKWPDIEAPVAKKIPKKLVAHNDERTDEYYWLNDRKNPEVIKYLEAENAYTDTMLAGTKTFQEKLFAEMKSRIREKDESLPYYDNGYWYYSRYEEGLQYPFTARKKGLLTAAEEVLLDQNALADKLPYFSVGGFSVSDNNELLAFTTDKVSRRLFDLQFKNLKTGKLYPEVIPNVEGSDFAWAADNKHLFYILQDTVTLLGYQVWRHELGTPAHRDVLMYEEKDNRYSLSLLRSKSKKYVCISSAINELSTEYLLLAADNPTGKFTVFQPREEGIQYSIVHYENKFFILTDWEAPNYRLMETAETETQKEHWKEVIPYSDSVYLDNMEIFHNHIVIGETRNALSQLRIINLKEKSEYLIPFEEKAYSANIHINPEFNTDTLRFSYTSMTTPASVYDYNMNTRERVLKKQTAVLGDFKKENYESDRLWVTSRDGTRVPLTLVYRKGLVKDGTAPLLLYGYGSYGYSMSPFFSSVNLSLLDRGFVYAIAHVRGGLELGRSWYDKGRMMNKKNSFFDFIDCAEYLIKENYTSGPHLYAQGGSAGGLLMGAVVNYRPDLFNGVVAQVPFVDVITTMSDTTIPLTTLEYKEWGNPTDSAEYTYMKSYSPYDNVGRSEYPNMLVTTGLNDSQVQYFEPAKWVARLRAMKTGKQVLLFRINMDYGHGGASGRFDYLKERALEFAFIFALEGILE
jgi:oligopeptidase B